MDEGLEGEFNPLNSLALADDLKALGCRAVWVCPGCCDVHPVVIARSSLRVLRQWLEVFLDSGAHATAATVVRFRV